MATIDGDKKKLSVKGEQLEQAVTDITEHKQDTTKHITESERTTWNAKQDALNFDTAPTEDSTNPVTSGGVYTAIATKQNALSQSQLAAANSGITAAKLTADEAAIAELVDSGAKNRIIFDGVGTGASNVGTSYTSNGITFEVQSDGTIRATGTISSGYSYCYLYAGTGRINIIDAFDGKHVLSGNPQGASASTYRLWYKVGSQTAVSVGDSSVILPEVTGETTAVLGLQVDAPQTNLDITFKPMICTKTAWDASPTYEPYAPTNRELYETCETKVTMQQVYGDAISIPAESNLNSYTTPGLYYALVASVSTIENTPYNATGFRLVVEKNTPSGAAVFHTLYPTSRSHFEFYRRIYEGGSWSSWYKFEGTQVATVQSSAASLMRAGRIEAEMTDAGTEEQDGEGGTT